MMKERVVRTLQLPWESYLFLQNYGYRMSKGKDHSEKFIKRMKAQFDGSSNKNGYNEVLDFMLGGLKDGKFIYWSIEDLKRLLDENNLTYGDEGETKVIDVYSDSK